MPIYQFETPEGQIVEEHLPMAEAPPIGEYHVINGITCRRVCERKQFDPKPDRRHVALNLPKNWKYAKRFDEQGHPVFTSKREIDETVARAKDSPMDSVSYGDI